MDQQLIELRARDDVIGLISTLESIVGVAEHVKVESIRGSLECGDDLGLDRGKADPIAGRQVAITGEDPHEITEVLIQMADRDQARVILRRLSVIEEIDLSRVPPHALTTLQSHGVAVFQRIGSAPLESTI